MMDDEHTIEAERQPAQSRADSIVSHLRERWDHLFRLTTVEQAMAALGLPPDDNLRLAVGDRLRAQPDIHQALVRWGPLTFILTEQEKLLARRLVRQGTQPGSRVSRAAIAGALHRSAAEIE